MDISRDSAITQCNANPKYNFLVEEVLQDTGSKDYYKNGPSSFDPVIGRLQGDIHYYTIASRENRSLMDALITNIGNAMKDPKDPGYKKASKEDLRRWNMECSKLQLEFVTYKGRLEQIQPKLDDCLFNRYIEDSRRNTMKMLSDKFFMDRDKDYLAKGVTWAMEYAEKHRINIDLDCLSS